MSSGVCELCGRESTTWLGNTEVCDKCFEAFYSEALMYLADAVIDLAEAWEVPYEDAFDTMMEVATFYGDLNVEARIEEEENEILGFLLEGPKTLDEIRLATGLHAPRALCRLSSLRKKSEVSVKHKGGKYFYEKEREDGKADTDD